MQHPNGVPRGAVLILSGAAAVAICYFGYRHFSQSPIQTQPDAKLHRSNAVRRRRRRWRQGSQPVELDYDPITRAVEHLAQREVSSQGYGIYSNKYYVNEELLASHGDAFALLPSRLEQIRDAITQAHTLSDEIGAQLLIHIQATFVQNFLQAELPDGYLVNGDADELASTFEPEVDTELLRHIVELHDHGAEIIKGDLWFQDEETEVTNNQPQGAAGIAQALSGQEGTRGARSGTPSWVEQPEQGDGQNILDLLYRIGEEQAKWSGYQHRGVECNGCGMQPIRGIRYHCANCWDYDLCETCEHQQIHHKTHVFYKIRIPAPTRGQIKLVQPKWYPGNPNVCPESVPKTLKVKLLKATNLDRQDLDALYDQFRCIAGKHRPDDPYEIGMAIDRPSFDRYFTSTTADRPPAPNLIYDRIFSFYDQDNDGLISFSEFAKGMAELANDTSREARIRRLFRAFDLDSNGYVSRRDFLHMLQAHYNLNKELAHEMIYARDDALLTDEEIHEVIHGNHPISAAFGGNNFASHRSRHGQGKHMSETGDFVLDDDFDDILCEDSRMMGNRANAIARQASDTRNLIQGHRLKNGEDTQDEPVVQGYRQPPIPTLREEDSIMGSPRSRDEGVDRLGHIADSWPTNHLHQEDVEQALGVGLPLDDVMDPVDRRRVLTAQRDRLFQELETNNAEAEQSALHDRWQRRQFYADVDEGFTRPAGYAESDSSDDDVPFINDMAAKTPPKSESRLSLRSRSSSKVRFDDSAVNNEVESKSDISSRNTPVNERWGGYEFSQPDREVGVELIYEAVQQAFNDMLNHFFKEKEDKAMSARASRPFREQYALELWKYEEALKKAVIDKEEALLQADLEHTEALLNAYGSGNAKNGVMPPEAVADDPEPRPQVDTEQYIACHTDSPIALENDLSIEERPDPTLPQNRPNEIQSEHNSEEIDEKPKLWIEPSLLKMWHEHNLIDREAQERGGHGRLNVQEFKRKLRDENTEIDIGGEGQEEDFWEAKADLGKFSFLSSWLEMASF